MGTTQRISTAAFYVALCGATVGAVIFLFQPAGQRRPSISVEALGPLLSQNHLIGEADVVLVGLAATQETSWNNVTNSAWSASASDQTTPLIYTKTHFLVSHVLKGTVDGGMLDVFTVGGRVGDIEMVFEQAQPVRVGRSYLLMLDLVDIPQQVGSVRGWLPIGLGQGIFVDSMSGFQNGAGTMTSIEDVERSARILPSD